MADVRAGIRFLNPRLEQDYGKHIFEDPRTHELTGVTPAARFHIICCDLNAEHLVVERRDRATIKTALNMIPATVVGSFAGLQGTLDALRAELVKMIPDIPPPP
ncbi:MAG: hypothetical protein M3463_14285 [Verrucomicrobiota bacterium]|nr:hypothetical protein [Verrucomicrobiota bacterium]